MPVVTEFRNSLASAFGIDAANIEVTSDSVNIAGTPLARPGDFDIAALLESYSMVERTPTKAIVTDGHQSITFSRVVVRPQPEYGIIEIVPGDAWLFLGDFEQTVDQLDLGQYPELLLCIACFEPRRISAVREWAVILESWGPFVASQGEPPLQALAEIGCFLQSAAPTLPDFSLPSKVRRFQARATTSTEAMNAYVLGLQSTDGPDVAFLRLYRIFELEFAATLKAEMSSAPLTQVYEKLRTLHSVSELDILKRTIDRSTVPISRFTCDNFRALFGADLPTREHYKKLARWLETGVALPNDSRALLIYYVRCALVHSKFSETERFLFGPFEADRSAALCHIVADMRDILRDILAV